MNEHTDPNPVPLRTPGIVVSILSGFILADEMYKRKIHRSLPWALIDRCITSSLGRRGILRTFIKRPMR